MGKHIITGGLGQIGTDLASALMKRYGSENVIVTDVREPGTDIGCEFQILDVTDAAAIEKLLSANKVDVVYHLAALLSATAEAKPDLGWKINMGSVVNFLNAARDHKYKLFIPSSIAAFGHSTPANMTPQVTIQRPETMYGVTKVAGEVLADYFFKKFGVDCRGARFPGLISYKALPGGGTTDYAVDIYYKAVAGEEFVCPIPEDTAMDMMYMDDAIDLVIKLMEAPIEKLTDHNAFNVAAFSATPRDFINAVSKKVPGFKYRIEPNPVLVKISSSWPNAMDDSEARKQWGHSHNYDIDAMTDVMLKNLKIKLNK